MKLPKQRDGLFDFEDYVNPVMDHIEDLTKFKKSRGIELADDWAHFRKCWAAYSQRYAFKKRWVDGITEFYQPQLEMLTWTSRMYYDLVSHNEHQREQRMLIAMEDGKVVKHLTVIK